MIEIVDILGRTIAEFYDGKMVSDYLTMSVPLSSTALKPGIYFISAKTKYAIFSKKLVVIR